VEARVAQRLEVLRQAGGAREDRLEARRAELGQVAPAEARRLAADGDRLLLHRAKALVEVLRVVRDHLFAAPQLAEELQHLVQLAVIGSLRAVVEEARAVEDLLRE